MLKKYGSHLIYFGVGIIFFLSFATLYGMYGKGWPMYKPWTVAQEKTKTLKPTIKDDTVIREEIRYLCGDKVTTKIPTTSELVGLEFSSLVQKYPPENGWSIDDSVDNTLVLARIENSVCPYHQDFRHLGISEGFLAVLEGPLGYNQKVLQREDISIESLPPDLQTELGLAMDYDNQEPDTQARLKALYEFVSENQLNSVLENFDEYKE